VLADTSKVLADEMAKQQEGPAVHLLGQLIDAVNPGRQGIYKAIVQGKESGNPLLEVISCKEDEFG